MAASQRQSHESCPPPAIKCASHPGDYTGGSPTDGKEAMASGPDQQQLEVFTGPSAYRLQDVADGHKPGPSSPCLSGSTPLQGGFVLFPSRCEAHFPTPSGLACDLLWLIEWSEIDIVPDLSLGLKKSCSFHSICGTLNTCCVNKLGLTCWRTLKRGPMHPRPASSQPAMQHVRDPHLGQQSCPVDPH